MPLTLTRTWLAPKPLAVSISATFWPMMLSRLRLYRALLSSSKLTSASLLAGLGCNGLRINPRCGYSSPGWRCKENFYIYKLVEQCMVGISRFALGSELGGYGYQSWSNRRWLFRKSSFQQRLANCWYAYGRLVILFCSQ